MALEDLLQRILREPSADDLWALHPHLLAITKPQAESAREVARLFYCYLNCVQSKLTSKQYSSLSALLAAGSVGMIVVQDVVESLQKGRKDTISELLAGGIAGVLETVSTFQHVKAWETEFLSVHDEVIWHLYAAFWQLSVETQPDLSADQRRALIDRLLVAIRHPDVDGGTRTALVIRLFQILLLIRLAPLISVATPERSP
jgi:hypothetical protein